MKSYKLKLSSRFQQEAREIAFSIYQLTKEEKTANKKYHMILDNAYSLEIFPERNQAFGECRILQAEKYSIVYKISGDVVEILRVVPSSSRYIARLRGNKPNE